MRVAFLPALLGLVLMGMLPASASAASAIEQLQAFHRNVDSLQATFSQVLIDARGETLQRSGGEVWLQRPQRFRWEYREPYPQVVVGDGRQVWIYDTELEQVTVKPVDQTVSSAPMLVLSGRRSLEEDFAIRELGRRGELDWVELTPKREEGDFQRVRIGFGETLREMELEDSFGQLSRIAFDDVKINPELDAERFRLQIPDNVDVVGDPDRP